MIKTYHCSTQPVNYQKYEINIENVCEKELFLHIYFCIFKNVTGCISLSYAYGFVRIKLMIDL
jgi:hypothetical protein